MTVPIRAANTKKSHGPGYAGSEVGGPDAPQTVSGNFAGVSLGDEFNFSGTGYIPPDSMGAAGPNNFVEVVNGAVAIFNKSGTQLSIVTLESFFSVTVSGTTYPRGGAFDPRILYDQHSGRFFATAMEFGVSSVQNGIVLAVSRTSDPTGVWDKYFINIGEASSFTDYATLGVDDNGVYFGMTIFPTSSAGFAKIAATSKASLLAASPSLSTVYQFSNITDMYSSPQPPLNYDTVASNGRAWFVSSSTTTYGNVNYRTLTWSGGVPSLSASSSVLTTPTYQEGINFTPSGSTSAIDTGDDRLIEAIIRNNQLWTLRTVGVNASGTSGTGTVRDAVEWLDLNVTNATATLTQSGRVFDSAASGARNYFYPSISVNGQGQMALGFSGATTTEFVGLYTTGRLASDPLGTTESIQLVQAGLASYTQVDGTGRNRWGDYGYGSVDPNDNMSMWMIGEYVLGTNNWGTEVADLLSPPPTLNNPGGSGNQGQSGVVVHLTGTGIYDPALDLRIGWECRSRAGRRMG